MIHVSIFEKEVAAARHHRLIAVTGKSNQERG
jgi:hypothetical protein